MCALGNHARSFDAVFCRTFTCLSRGFVQTHDSRGCEMAPFDDRSARNTHIRHTRYTHCSSSTRRSTWPPRPPFVRRCRIDSQAGCGHKDSHQTRVRRVAMQCAAQLKTRRIAKSGPFANGACALRNAATSYRCRRVGHKAAQPVRIMAAPPRAASE